MLPVNGISKKNTFKCIDAIVVVRDEIDSKQSEKGILIVPRIGERECKISIGKQK